jgi:hypothetical protein
MWPARLEVPEEIVLRCYGPTSETFGLLAYLHPETSSILYRETASYAISGLYWDSVSTYLPLDPSFFGRNSAKKVADMQVHRS